MIIEDFLTYLRYELNLSAYTVLCYKTDLGQMVEFLCGGDAAAFDAGTVTAADVRAWMAWLAKRGVGQRSVRRKVQAVRALYKYLMRQGKAVENPAADVEMAKVRRRLPQTVREENLNVLLDEEVDCTDFTAVRDKLMVMMLYATGMRRAELIGLLDANVGIDELKVLGKRNKERVIPFARELSEWIARYREVRERTGATSPEGAFFTRPDGKPLYPMLVERVVHGSLDRVGGSQRRSPHVHRHTFASAMLNGGAQLNSVKELLGHSTLAATQVYTHITFGDLKSNYEHAHPRALKKGGRYGS